MGGKQFTNFSLGHEMGVVVPGAGLEPATFGCLRHHKGLCTSYDRLGGCPMSPTRYQLRHPGLSRG